MMDTEVPVLIDTGSGYTIKYKGKFLYSSVQPEIIIKKRVSRIYPGEKTLYFIPSLGLGYGIDALLEKLPVSSYILCIEVDEILFNFGKKQQAAPIPSHDRLAVLRISNIHALHQFLKQIGLWKFRKAEMIVLCAGIHLYKQKYQEMFIFIENEIQQFWKNKMTLINMAPLWIKNIFSNLSLFQTASDISALQFDLPVVVVGAGPSLEQSISDIKRVRKKIILIAVDTAFPPLYQLGVLPDYIFVLESQVVNLLDFVICRNPGIPLICDITSHPGVIRLFNNKIYLFTSFFSRINLFKRMEDAGLLPTVLPALGSVGVALVYAALRLTTGPVFLAGLDFGYVKNMTHSKGTAYYQILECKSTRIRPLEDLIYKTILSRPLIRKQGKQKNNILTDLVLNAYAGQIPVVTRDRDGVYDIGEDGLDLGVHKISGEEMHQLVIENKQYEPSMFEKETIFKLPQSGTVNRFLLAEKKYLDECGQVILPLVEAKRRKQKNFYPGEYSALKAVDYVYLHFPDQADLPVYDQNFLFRTLISIKHYEAIINHALSINE